MARCERCGGCRNIWDIKPCPHCLYPFSEDKEEAAREILKRSKDAIVKEYEENEKSLWYVTFWGLDGFKGAMFIMAYGFYSALLVISILSEHSAGRLRLEKFPVHEPWPDKIWWYRLLSSTELKKMNKERKK